jgi:hypothetical protein
VSGSDVPGRDDRTRRAERPDPDATRQVGEPAPHDAGVTRRIEPPPGAGGAAGSADPTRQIDPVTGYGEGAYGDDDGYVTVPDRPPGEGEEPVVDEELVEEEPARNRGRDWAIGLGGVAVGILLAVIVAFLAGGDDDPLAGDVAAAERIEALEAERDDLAAQNDALEARAADAEAAAGQGDADLAAQRQALDDRASALDGRASALDQREGALDDRERALDDRESALERREAEAPGGGGDGEGDGGDGGGIDLPDIDSEEVEGFFDRLFERIRDLF